MLGFWLDTILVIIGIVEVFFDQIYIYLHITHTQYLSIYRIQFKIERFGISAYNEGNLI